MIESFEITSQGTVIVTITAANGGKEFVLDAKINDDVAPEVLGVTGTAATEAIGGTGGNADKFLTSLTVTFTEAIQLADSADILDAFTLGSDASTTAVLAEDGKSITLTFETTSKVSSTSTLKVVADKLVDLNDNAFEEETVNLTVSDEGAVSITSAE